MVTQWFLYSKDLPKWTVFVVKVDCLWDGSNNYKWTIMHETEWSKRLKMDGLRKWTILKSTGRFELRMNHLTQNDDTTMFRTCMYNVI